MSDLRLIALNGRLHSGKDTAVEFIRQSAAPQVVQRLGFADKLKISVARALGFDGDTEACIQFCNDLKEYGSIHIQADGMIREFDITGRQYLQWYGTEAHRRVFGDDFWVDALLPLPVGDRSIAGEGPWTEADSDRANQIVLGQRFPKAEVLVITDCRFPNEAKRVLSLGGEVWYINAEDRLGPLPEDAHVSEHPLPEEFITSTVDNNHDLDHYQEEIGRVWRTTSLT